MIDTAALEIIRAILYVVGILASMTMAGHLLRLRHPLAKLLFVAMLAWAFNCAMLLVGVWALIQWDGFPSWHYYMRTINTLFLAFVPIIMYIGFWRINGRPRA